VVHPEAQSDARHLRRVLNRSTHPRTLRKLGTSLTGPSKPACNSVAVGAMVDTGRDLSAQRCLKVLSNRPRTIGADSPQIQMYLVLPRRQSCSIAEPPASTLPADSLTERIHVIRGERVMLDVDLARLYGVTTARLNQQVKRNPVRFPVSFMFQLTASEFANVNLLQNVTGSLRHRDPRLRPYAFTEHGCLMISNVLKTQLAVEVSILVVQAFILLRSAVAANHDLARRIDELSRAIDQQMGRPPHACGTSDRHPSDAQGHQAAHYSDSNGRHRSQ
jgi:ORF6N domain